MNALPAAAARSIGKMAKLITALGYSCAVLTAAPPSEYAGSKTCFGCHSDIYGKYTQTAMGRSMRIAGEVKPGPIPADANVPVSGTNRALRVSHNASGWRQAESEPNVFNDEHALDYAVGSGANGLSFIVRRGDALFQAPLSFYSKTGQWDLSPGYGAGDLGFSRPIAAQCLACHSGRSQPVENREGQYLNPPLPELAIGCENCHGPGGRHVLNPKNASLIVNPRKLPARLAEDICMNCHQGGDARTLQPGRHAGDFRPGQWLIDTAVLFKVPPQAGDGRESDLLEHNSAMKLSRCFRESNGKLSCLTCHDPHVQPGAAEAATYFRAKCLACHTSESCRLPIAARQATTPGDNCIGCHMPKRDVATISHSALTNHRIPARPGEALPASSAQMAGGLVVVNQPPGRPVSVPEMTLLKAYSELAGRNPQFQERYLDLLARLAAVQPDDSFIQAALGHKALAEGHYEAAIVYLKAGLKLDTATADADMAQALTKLGRAEEALPFLESAVQKAPYDAALLKTLTLQYINLHRYAEAEEKMRKYVELFPQDSFMRNLLARVSH